MADNRKYYYLKLKENFFDSDSIVLLEDMKDGILYSNILLKLYLKSLKNGGRLQLDEHIPYTAQMIATLTRHQIGTVERALAIFQQLGLVEQLDCGLLYMTDIELMIGQSSTEAERKRAARLENKALLPPRTNGGHLSDIRPPEIEIKKEIDIELEKEGELKGQALARSYGRYENVFLTDTELSELQAELPEKWAYYIERLSGYIASTGKKYKNHAATIRRWAASGEEQPKENKVTKIASGFLGVVVLIALAAGGGFYVFAKQKQKKQAEKEALDPDANYTEDKGDFEIPTDVPDEDETPDEQDTEPI